VYITYKSFVHTSGKTKQSLKHFIVQLMHTNYKILILLK